MAPPSSPQKPLRQSEILRAWIPLALSWNFMAADALMFSSFVGRMPDAKLALASWGAIVFAVSLVIEGPVIMLLAAGTALAKDAENYRRLMRYTHVLAWGLTFLHALVAFTPVYDWVATVLLDAEPELIEPGRTGLRIMLPWTGMIAYRRLLQGVLIRFDQSRWVAIGTFVRVLAVATVMVVGSSMEGVSGIVVGSAAIATGVTAEAAFVAVVVRPVLRGPLQEARRPAGEETLDVGRFLRFYVPLAMTPLLTLLLQPLGAAAMNRMPHEVLSAAAWQPVHGLIFYTRSFGFALNEVVVAKLDRPGAVPALRRFTVVLSLCTMLLLVALAATPLSDLWFRVVYDLPDEVASVAVGAMIIAVLMPGYQCLQSWYQGNLVRHEHTRPVTEAVALYLAISAFGLALGVAFVDMLGIRWALISFSTAGVLQTLHLRWRTRPFLRSG